MPTTVHFYEKPGCANNQRQKQWLRTAGHALIVHNLMTEAWTAERLRRFFGTLPVIDWFNRAAPSIKSGKIQPYLVAESAALALMLADPLLIRRPLMEADSGYRCGFDTEAINVWIGLSPAVAERLATVDTETCLHPSTESNICGANA